jgi:hypothetical protein
MKMTSLDDAPGLKAFDLGHLIQQPEAAAPSNFQGRSFVAALLWMTAVFV